MAYQRGLAFACPKCHRDSIVQVKVVFDGWTAKGERFVCALCGADLGDAKPVTAQPAGPDPKTAAATNKAADFLGTNIADKPRMDTKGLKKVFCRDCKHFLTHPFDSRCLLRDRKVEPMMDCPEFEATATGQPKDDPFAPKK